MASHRHNRGSGFALAGFLLISAIVGGIASALTLPNIPSWYHRLHLPSWTPPDWVFGPVWTALYILMAISAWLVWRERRHGQARFERDRGLRLYSVQLLLNALWSPLFFGLHQLTIGLIDITALLVVLLLTIGSFFRTNSNAGLLMLPYLAWVSYATSLNLGILWLNFGPVH